MLDSIRYSVKLNEPENIVGMLPGSRHNSYRERMEVMPRESYTRKPRIRKVCAYAGCDRKHSGRGWCARHLRHINEFGYESPKRTKYDANETVTDGSYATIILYDSFGVQVSSALVDAEDLGKCSAFKWHLSSRNGKILAVETSLGKGVALKLHHLIMGKRSGMVIDHINGDATDNRKDNLRWCLSKDNIKNSGPHKDNITGYKGVAYHPQINKWAASIMANRKSYYLGVFRTPEAAALAYNEAAKRLHGEFAYLNPIPG